MPSYKEIQGINIAHNPLQLDEVRGQVICVKLSGPSEDGDGQIELKIKLENSTNSDWHYFVIRTQFLSDMGQIIEETRDVYEQDILIGDSNEFETYQSIRWSLLGKNPSAARVIVNIVACGVALQEIGQHDVLIDAYKTTPLTPVELPKCVRIANGAFWKTEPDSDKDAGVAVKALVQNLTTLHLPEVRLLASVIDKAGREFTDAGGGEELRPGEILLLTGYGYAKDKQFKGSRIVLSLRAYFPLASGIIGHSGFEMADGKNADQHEDLGDDEGQKHRVTEVYVRGISELEGVKSGGVDAFLIFATNNPESIMPDEFTEIAFPSSDSAGALEPPTGPGEAVLTQEQMNQAGGIVAIEEVLLHIPELRKLLKKRFDLCAVEDGADFKAVDLRQFILAVESKAFKFLRVVHIEA